MALSPDGSISGQLANKTKFTFHYPVDLQDPQFAQLLDRDNVQVTAPPTRTSGPSATVDIEMSASPARVNRAYSRSSSSASQKKGGWRDRDRRDRRGCVRVG